MSDGRQPVSRPVGLGAGCVSTTQGWSLEVRDGAVVEVIGPCETSAEREREATSVYRTGPDVVTFVTRGRERPLVLLTRLGATS